MASTYPSVTATLTYPNANSKLNSPSHSSIHGAVNDEVIQLETFVGTLSSAVGTLVYDIRAAASGGGGHVQTPQFGGTGQTSFTKGDVLVGQSSSVLSKLAIGVDGKVLTADSTQSTGVKWGSSGKFGGTGADGDLIIASGTTTVNLNSASILTKNYSSIQITGTGQLNFSNPNTNGTVIILKSVGNVTITSSTSPAIDASGNGGQGGASIAGTSGGTQVAGNAGTSGRSLSMYLTNSFAGQGGTTNSSPGGGASSVVTSIANPLPFPLIPSISRYQLLVCGSGGASGNGTSASGQTYQSGTGGSGGPVLIIECGGALNLTGNISVNGTNGLNGVTRAGGGGGGGGGILYIYYNTLTTNTGSVTALGGQGGSVSSGGNTAGGGAGASFNISGGSSNQSVAGIGGNGFTTIVQNDTFS